MKARTIDWTQDVCQICQVAYQNQYGRQIECERKFPKTDIRQNARYNVREMATIYAMQGSAR